MTKSKCICLLIFLFIDCFASSSARAEVEDWQRAGIEAALADANEEVKKLALRKIIALGDVGLTEQVRALLASDDTLLVQWAIQALAASGVDAEVIASRVSDFSLDPENSRVDSNFMLWIGNWRPDSGKHSPSVQTLLSYTADIRVHGFNAYAGLVEDLPFAFEQSLQILKTTTDENTRMGVASAYIAFGPRLRAYIPQLETLLDTSQPRKKLEAIRILLAQNVAIDQFAD